MQQQKVIRVLFICLGNICRSPMAEAVFRHLVEQAGLASHFDIESAGTGNWHAGERPHRETLAVLSRNHIPLNGKRARQVTRSDMSEFDYIVAMDADNSSDLNAMFGRQVPRLLEFAGEQEPFDVPDPFYNGNFDVVYQLVQSGCQGLLASIRQKEGL